MSARRRSAALRAALRDRRVLVVCGSGGVGKTTTAAALALQAARWGRRVLVCTFDPSRRLATSLGLRALAERPRALSLAGLGELVPGGSLAAMALDTQRTFDALVARYAPDEAAQRRILDNRFYRQISAALAGTHEYMAMEKLLDLQADRRYDLVVLDTPPTRHALDFIEAPERLLAFLDTSVLRFFLRPYFAAGRLTVQVASRTGALLLHLADRVLGLQFLQDLSEFFLAFEALYDGFRERAARVQALLREPATGFVLVAAPQPGSLEEALYFHTRLRGSNLPFVSFVVNRLHPAPAGGRRPTGTLAPAGRVLEPGLQALLVRLHAQQRALAASDRRRVAHLVQATHAPLAVVPEFDSDVHDLRGLCEVAMALFEGRPDERPLADAPDAARARGTRRSAAW